MISSITTQSFVHECGVLKKYLPLSCTFKNIFKKIVKLVFRLLVVIPTQFMLKKQKNKFLFFIRFHRFTLFPWNSLAHHLIFLNTPATFTSISMFHLAYYRASLNFLSFLHYYHTPTKFLNLQFKFTKYPIFKPPFLCTFS